MTVETALPRGGSFLLGDTSPEQVFIPEDYTPEHRAIIGTTESFWKRDVEPRLHEIQHGNHDAAVELLRLSGQLGLLAVMVPEKFGGMEMDMASMMLVAEGVARDGSYAAWHGAHAGIGTLPLLLFGTEEQKAKYLPKLATAEWVGAYCLSEPHAGSDALAARTRADLAAGGDYYVLSGQKMWITNGGKADLFTVFAKVNGEQFTAFLVERGWDGVRSGPEERKMGIKGSSTTPVYFDNVRVPKENVLGEVGRGHVIAFNILNIGRLKLGSFAVGGARAVLNESIAYARDRKAFGKSIADFGMIRQKLAQMAIRLYATESMTTRVIGLIEQHLQGFSWEQPDASARMLKAFEEFAAECSYVKVYASEMLDFVVDEGVQIHGGYGFHQDYKVETAYRDSRVNRIFEGTNEINRLLATGMLLKRAQRGQLPLVDAVKKLQAELLSGPSSDNGNEEMRLIRSSRKIALLLFGASYQKFGAAIEQQQEVLAGIADVCMNAFTMESAYLRAARTKSAMAADMTAVLMREMMDAVDASAREVLSACAEGDALRTQLTVLRRFTRSEAVNTIGLRQKIAERLISTGRLVL